MESTTRNFADLALRGLVASGSMLVLLAAWEFVARSGAVSNFLLPPLSSVLQHIFGELVEGTLFWPLALTLWRALAGFAIAGVIGVTLGVLLIRSRWVRWFFDPLVSVGLPAPKIAFLPIFILWFGFFDLTKILIAAFAATFPVIVATAAATQGIDKHLIWSARNCGASERHILWEIVLPAAMPQIMTALQVALPITLIVTIVAEMSMGGNGLGADMMRSARFAHSTGVFAGIIKIAVVGILAIKCLEFVRRRLLVWHQESEQPATF
jgi:taurine transport system permease protein